MKYLLYMTFLSVLSLNAKDYNVKNYELDKHGLKMGGPQTFIINDKGNIVAYYSKYSNQIRSGFNNTEPVENSNGLKRALETVMKTEIKVDKGNYSLIQIVYDKSNTNVHCAPCDQQLIVNSRVVEAMSKQGTQVTILTVNMESVSTFIKDW